MTLPKNGVFGFLGKIYGDMSENAKSDTKTYVIMVQFLAIIALSIVAFTSDKKSDEAKDRLIQRLWEMAEPRIERQVNREVNQQTDEIIKGVDRAIDGVEELKKTVSNKMDSITK